MEADNDLERARLYFGMLNIRTREARRLVPIIRALLNKSGENVAALDPTGQSTAEDIERLLDEHYLRSSLASESKDTAITR